MCINIALYLCAYTTCRSNNYTLNSPLRAYLRLEHPVNFSRLATQHQPNFRVHALLSQYFGKTATFVVIFSTFQITLVFFGKFL